MKHSFIYGIIEFGSSFAHYRLWMKDKIIMVHCAHRHHSHCVGFILDQSSVKCFESLRRSSILQITCPASRYDFTIISNDVPIILSLFADYLLKILICHSWIDKLHTVYTWTDAESIEGGVLRAECVQGVKLILYQHITWRRHWEISLWECWEYFIVLCHLVLVFPLASIYKSSANFLIENWTDSCIENPNL